MRDRCNTTVTVIYLICSFNSLLDDELGFRWMYVCDSTYLHRKRWNHITYHACGHGVAPLFQLLQHMASISTTNLAACVCVSSKFDQFLPLRFYFVSKRPENFVRIAKFPYAAFGPLFAFQCPLFVTKNNNLGWNRHRRFATHRNMQVQRSRPTVLSARGQ